MSRAITPFKSSSSEFIGLTKARSDSSPGRMVTPEKSLSPVAKSVELKIPLLDLSRQTGHAGVIKPSSEPVLVSPKSTSTSSPRMRFSVSFVAGTQSAPSTPRAKSPRPIDEVRSPRRSRIETSPRKTLDFGKREVSAQPDVQPSPRKSNDELMQLGREAAKLIFQEMKAKTPVLTKATIDQLGRFETPIPTLALSATLRSRLANTSGATVSHAKLIKALFGPLLAQSAAGKTVSTMRRDVMERHDGYALTIARRIELESDDPEFREHMLEKIAPQGRACAAVVLELKSTAVSESKLPAELIAFWKAMDAELCNWASGNPDLSASEVRKARANLGFDLLFTRLLLPMASGPKEEAHLALPAMFFDSVKRALLADWPAFVDRFLSAIDQERASTVLQGSTSASVSSELPEPREGGEVSQE